MKGRERRRSHIDYFNDGFSFFPFSFFIQLIYWRERDVCICVWVFFCCVGSSFNKHRESFCFGGVFLVCVFGFEWSEGLTKIGLCTDTQTDTERHGTPTDCNDRDTHI